MPNIGPVELIILLVIALLVLGPRRLPEMGSAVGKTIREFRKASTEITEAATIDTRLETRPSSAGPSSSRLTSTMAEDESRGP
ncbi:MAG: twin-arginine translocase TatA/TatE family subunit, partial [Chloroflexi bacterium]|nr:twin-arginine translocase TatA/TatE family subunit [Chloroflexota bacterium]